MPALTYATTCGMLPATAYTKLGLLITRLQSLLELAQRLQPVTLVFPDPTLGDLMNRDGIEVVQLLAAALDGRDQIGALQNPQMLADRLPRHGKPRTQLVQGLTVLRVEPIEKLAAARVGQRPEHVIHGHNMQPFGCLSRDVAPATPANAAAPTPPPALRRSDRSASRRARSGSRIAACAAAVARSRR